MEREYLTEEELRAFASIELANANYAQARDLFIFGAMTGISFIDIKNLTTDNIVEMNDYHLKMFDYMASRLAPYVNFCVFSFVEMYKRLEYNMPELIPLTDRDKEKLEREWAQSLGDTGCICKPVGHRKITADTEYPFLVV